jgi:hypothetical protein
MTTERFDQTVSPPAGRMGMRPVTRAFLGGTVLGLVLGGVIGFAVATGVKSGPKWADAGGTFVRLPEQTQLGPLPQTVILPAASYDFGGVGEPLNQAVTDNSAIVKVDLQAVAGRVGVSLAKPDGGELVSREAVVTPAQGKTTVYFRTGPGMGPLSVLLRSADNTPAGASATVTKVQTAKQADIGQGEMNRINQAGVY